MVHHAELVPLDEDQIDRLADRLLVWSYGHPSPDQPLLGFAGTGMLSAREVYLSVERRTNEGEAIILMVAKSMAVLGADVTFDEILDGFAVVD